MKRILSVFLCLWLVGTCLLTMAACGGEDVTTTDPDGCGGLPPPNQTLAQLLIEEGYTLIGPTNASKTVNAACTRMEEAIHAASGKKIPVTDDFVKRGQTIPSENLEILVSKTNRASSKAAYEALYTNRKNAGMDWQIKMENKEVIIIAGSDAGIGAAAEAFVKMLQQPAQSFSLESYDSGIQLHPWEIETLGNISLGDYKIILPEGASTELQTAAAEFQEKIAAASGFSPEILTDQTAPGSTELILGQTNRTVSASALQLLQQNRPNYAYDTAYLADNGRIAITGGSENAVMEAIAKFGLEYLNKETQGSVATLNKILEKESIRNLEIGGSNVSEFSIVHAEGADFDTRYLAYQMQKLIYEQYGSTLKILTDASPATGKEILIGGTNRAASTATALDAYSLKVDQKGNLVLDAGHYIGLQQAYRDLVANWDAQSGKTVSLASNYAASGKADAIPLTWDYDGSADTLLGSSKKPNSYKLVWNDEFGAEKIDYEKWSGFSNMTMKQTTLRFDEEGSDAVSLQDGELVMKTDFIDQDARKYYSNYAVTTHDTMNFSGGYLEMRAKVPFKGLGEWPSFWSTSTHTVLFKKAYRDAHNGELYDAGYRLEVDFFEQFSSKDTIVPNLHKAFCNTDNTQRLFWKDANGKTEAPTRIQLSGVDAGVNIENSGTRGYKFKAKDGKTAQEVANDYHTYGFLWTDDLMAFSVDGEFYYAYSMADVPGGNKFNPTYYDYETKEKVQIQMDGYRKGNVALAIILNDMFFPETYTDTPGAFGYNYRLDPKNDAELFPLIYKVDYMRLYQCDTDQIFTPEVLGNGKMLFSPSDHDYAMKGTK